jgi:acyl-CoA synthetase
MTATFTLNEARKAQYRRQGYWGDASLADYWQWAVRTAPDKRAVSDWQGSHYTYAEMDEQSSRLASALKEYGVKPGDRVALQLPGWSEFTLIFLACLKVGAVTVPLLPTYRETESRYILNKCGVSVLFVAAEFKNYNLLEIIRGLRDELPQLKHVVAVAKKPLDGPEVKLDQLLKDYPPLAEPTPAGADELAVVLFTSGTEGMPKGVMLTHNNLIASERSYCASLNLTYRDTMLMPAPLAHASGFMHGVVAPFVMVGHSVLLDIFTPEACLQLLEQEKCTAIAGPTPFVSDLLCLLQKAPHDISSLRFFLCGGTTVPRSMVKACLQQGFKVISVYGATESAPHTMVRLEDPVERVINTDGKAVTGVEVRVVDPCHQTVPCDTEGEEASRGPSVFVGYFDEPEMSAKALDEEGWYYSGDLCRMDNQGYIRITGRKKDIIVRGGENISSREVEDILLQHPNVKEAGIVAMPDQRLGERACAYLVLRDPQQPFSFDDMVAFFSSKRVAKYKYPERLELMSSLPRTASGKIVKYLLRKDIVNKLQKEQSQGLCMCSDSNDKATQAETAANATARPAHHHG